MESGSPQRRSRSSSPLRGTPGIAFVLVLLCLSGLPLGGGAAPSPSAPITSSVHPPPVPATVTAYVHNVTTGDLSNFWGVGVTPDTPLTNTTAEVASTPIHWYEWPAGKIADAYNMTSGQVWTNGFASYDASNETQFVQWCKSTSCHAIFAVPGETNNTTTAAWDVAYTENVLGFHPDYWQVGNEPYGWSHFGLPWARWTTTNTLNVTATVYAQVVNRYIAAMRAVDPTLQFIGLSGVGAGKSPDMPWIGATVALNGPNLSAIAIHTYPAEHRGTSGTAAGFLGTLLGTDAPQYRIPNDTKAILANCTAYWPSNATCVGIRLFVDEFGSGTGTTGGWQPFMQTYPEVPFITAELLTMIRANVTNADLYDLRSSYNGSLFNLTGSPLPLDSLYTHILPHFDSTPLLTTMTPTVGPVFAEASESTQSNSVTLLAVNTNTVQNITLKVRGPVFPSYGSFSAWRASDPNGSANGTFTHSTGFGLLSSWVLPPMGVLLVSMCRPVPSASVGNSVYAVTFCEAGLPSGTNWSVTVGASTVYSTSSAITFYEPNGTIGYHIGGVANWSTASPSGFVTVNATPASVSVPWTEVTYPVSFLENGLPGGVPWSVVVNGTVYRSMTTTINLNAPNGTHSYAIGVVPGWTVSNFHGNFTVNAAAVAVVVNWTRVLYPLTFAESGLSNGTNWSVVANGTNLSSTGLTISFSEPNGTFQYSVGSVAGLTPVTYSGAVTVDGAAVVVPISWNATPSALWFNETGLPIGKPWSVTLNGTPQAAATASFTFYEPSGMYSYLIGTIPGWSTPSYHGVVTPSGASLTTNVVWTQANYTVTFNETNLPLATSWTVSLNGTNQSSPTKSIVFSELNGTYPYVLYGVPGYHPQFGSTGSVVVNGSSLVVSVPWKRNVFTVNFNETGLPVNGFPWYVNVTGTSFSPHAKSFGSTSPVFVSNGSYTYSVSPSVATFGATVPYGNFTVNGTFVDVNVTFAAVYTLTFTETGLPNGTNWSVTILNQVSESSTTTSIAFKETNGLYNFSFRPIPGWSPSTTGRSVTVFGANVGVSVSWSVAMYSVTFNETGLPSGTAWSVTLNGILQSGPGGNLTFSEPNGTFGWSLGVVPGWTTSSFSGSVTVQGNSVVVLVTWTQVTYTVTFTESGLTAGTSWSVNLSGMVSSSISTTIRFNEPNGTYAYAVGPLAGRTAHPASGNVPVSGGSASVAILWTLKTYGVTFMESNLTAGTTWSVTFNGTTNSSSTSSIGFYAPNGTYGYTIGALGGWTTPSYTGTVTINGNGATVTLVWTGVKSTVTFKERGLPSGSLWNVTIGGITITNTTSGTSGWITFSLYDGSYNFLVGTLPNRSASPSHGTVVVSGVDQSIAIVWSHLKAYFVTFTESGLPSGTGWSLSLGNSTLSSTTPTIVFSEFNGTYNYSVPAASGYTATPARGTLQVTGADLAETLSFSLSTAPTYPVTFLESGLSGGTRWFVTIGGTTDNSTTDQIVFQLPNGTSSWQVPLVAGYQAGTSSGTVNVVGAGQTVDVVFVATPILYTLTFSESGLPSGTSWSVTIGGVTHESNGSGSVTFQEPNGTYTYQVGSVSGYSVSSSTGSTTLSGAAKAVRLTFTANPGTPRAFGGLSTLDWGIIGGGIAIILIALLVTLGLRGKGKEPATSLGTPPPSGASGPPSPP